MIKDINLSEFNLNEHNINKLNNIVSSRIKDYSQFDLSELNELKLWKEKIARQIEKGRLFIDEINPVFLRRLKKKYFYKNCPIHISKDLEGQSIIDGNITIGCQSGPIFCEEALCHEMAHFVEIDEKRMGQYGWGLNVPQVEILGQYVFELKGTVHIKREIRVWAYQLNLQKSIGMHTTPEDLAKSSIYLANIHMIIPDYNKIPYRERNNEAIRYVSEEIEKKSKIYTLEKFDYEWKRRCKILENKKQ